MILKPAVTGNQWRICNTNITVVKARDDQWLYKELSSLHSQIEPDYLDVV